jgi:hypothetical protein
MLGAQVYNPTGVAVLHRESAGTVRGFPACISDSKRRPTMPLFHFNSLTSDLFLPDPEGEELPNIDSAREVAEQSAREALIEAVKTGDTAPDCIQVTDSEGREVATVFLEDLLDG